ncbi:MAG: hypothetical protein PHT69_08570 [Bacteroidales bacterium]|nr:hypothetical protein [Bacteroidales bacterium]
MCNRIKYQSIALKAYFDALKELYEEGILINKKDFTGQIGEWIVSSIYNGERAKSGVQKGWDVVVNGKYIQVKSHAKALKNSVKWSAIEINSTEIIDELIIIIFSHDYKIRTFYKLPWKDALKHIEQRGKKKIKNIIKWEKLKKFEVEINRLPKKEIISLFI